LARILIIEDTQEEREMLQEMLGTQGHDVVVAPNGEEGLAVYREEPVDLVITDIIMPKKDGVETIRELRREDPDIKVIAITGARGTFNRLPAAEYVGAHRTLMKPFMMSELLDAVREELEA
jgi:DNA-binding response OmpR family regulator